MGARCHRHPHHPTASPSWGLTPGSAHPLFLPQAPGSVRPRSLPQHAWTLGEDLHPPNAGPAEKSAASKPRLPRSPADIALGAAPLRPAPHGHRHPLECRPGVPPGPPPGLTGGNGARALGVPSWRKGRLVAGSSLRELEHPRPRLPAALSQLHSEHSARPAKRPGHQPQWVPEA